MKYKAFIEEYFLIDEPKQGKLVPFVFNDVQNEYYDELVALGIEENGISAALREFIVKARREGFSSLILALFAADDILQQAPTESQAVSYKEDATGIFRKRYRRFVLSYYAQKAGTTVAEIQADANVLEKYARAAFSVDANDLELRHNKAHFFCGTAAARTGGRGGVLQKLLFSESAYYQDTERITAKEIVESTSQQIDRNSGWVFQETTANGVANYHYQTFEKIKAGTSRWILRFYGALKFYTEDELEMIKSGFTDPHMFQQEYPRTIEEAFLSSNLAYTSSEEILALVGANGLKRMYGHLELGGLNYIDQAELITEWINTIVKTNQNRNIYVGIDTAKSHDRTVATALIEKDMVARGGVKGLCIDATGQGDFMPDWFERHAGWHVKRVKFSRQTKSVMYTILQSIIKDRQTELPQFIVNQEFTTEEWKHFYNQMIKLEKKIVGSLLVISHPMGDNNSGDYDTAPHDDYPDSWALAELLYVEKRGAPAGIKAEKEVPNYTSDAVRKLLRTPSNAQSQPAGDEFI